MLSQQAIVRERTAEPRVAGALKSLDVGLFGRFTDLVNLDDVALGIVEEV